MNFCRSLHLTEQQKLIGAQILKEIKARIGFLIDVGLDYLTLARATGTLSGGEAQRIRLATQIGSGLVGVAYILDEPSIGLHQRDNDKLLATLKRLRDLGNTLIVVEHDEDTMLAADYIVDIGPGAGEHGGKGGGSGYGRGDHGQPGFHHRSVSERTDARSRCRKPRRTPAGWLTVKGAAGEQPEKYRCGFPLGRHDLRDRCVRFRQELPGQ